MRNLPALSVIRFAVALAVALGATLAAPGAPSCKQAARPEDFAKYLKDAKLDGLYAAELKRMCLEEADPAACDQFAEGLLADEKYGRAAGFADSLKSRSADIAAAAAMIKCRALYGAGRYAEAAAALDSLVAAMPAEERLAEAVDLRAKCHYNLGRCAEALINLRAVEPYVKASGRAGYAVWLAKCEEECGDLDRAARLYEEAWKAGSPEAALGLARCYLRRAKPDPYLGVLKDAAKRGAKPPSDQVCDLAILVGDAAPELWHPLARFLAADTLFSVDARPELAAGLARLAEFGENVGPYCDALLGRAGSESARQSLRYARALGRDRDAGATDSLEALAADTAEPLLKVRCLAAAIGIAPQRKADLTRSLASGAHEATALLGTDDRLELCRIMIAGGAREVASAELRAMLGGLRAGYDDHVLAGIAYLLEAAGDREAALEVSGLVTESPVLSASSLACEKMACLAINLAKPEIDIAKEVEKIAKKGASDLELGDLFADKLKDYERASVYYAGVVEAPPKGVKQDVVRLKLARALALASFAAPPAAGGGGADLRRSQALGHLAAIAQSDAVKPDEVIGAVKLATDWLEFDQARAVDVAGAIAQRKDLTAASLYGAANLVFGVLLRGNPDYYERCATLLGRIATDFPKSKEAPYARLALGRVRYAAGDYPAARDAFEAGRGKDRDGVLAGLSSDGAGECLLSSGGLADALPVLGQVKWWRTLYQSARVYGLLGRADSAETYYRAVMAGPAPAHAVGRSRLGLALACAASGRTGAAFDALDSPLPATREGLKDARRLLAAYTLGTSGYGRFGGGVLARLAASDSPVACEAALAAANLLGSDSPEDASALVEAADHGDVFEEYSLALGRSRYACSVPEPAPCAEAAQRFRKRFPLDLKSSAELDARRALALAGEAGADSAAATADSLAAAAGAHPLLAELLYARGISLLVRGDYSGAKQTFGTVVSDYWGSELYRDACFKMGSTYYLMERYDSSSVYFALAALGDKPALARDALFNRGLALEEIGAFDLAAEVYRTLAVRFPFSDQFERALVRRGYCLQSDGRPAEAVAAYKGLLGYADSGETRAETMYWIGEALSAMGDHARAACEFLRVSFVHPSEQAWAGTAAFMAGAECEKAGLTDHAITIYRQNVRKFGKASDWGKASDQRLAELLKGAGTQDGETPGGRRGGGAEGE